MWMRGTLVSRGSVWHREWTTSNHRGNDSQDCLPQGVARFGGQRSERAHIPQPRYFVERASRGQPDRYSTSEICSCQRKVRESLVWSAKKVIVDIIQREKMDSLQMRSIETLTQYHSFMHTLTCQMAGCQSLIIPISVRINLNMVEKPCWSQMRNLNVLKANY